MIMSLPSTVCEDLDDDVYDALTSSKNFTRVFEYYQLFLLLLIPLMCLLPRILYPLGLKLSGGVPDLDFLIDDEPTGMVGQDSLSSQPSGTGSGLNTTEVDVSVGEGNTKWFSGQKPDAVAVEMDSAGKENWFRQAAGDAKANSQNKGLEDNAEIDLDVLLTHNDNKSVAISFAGYLIGIALMYRGTVSATIHDYPSDYDFGDQMEDICPTLLLLFFGSICLLLCHIVNDKIIIPGIRNISALDAKAKFTAVGIVEAGSFVSTGQILGAASYSYVDVSEGDSWGEAIFMQFFWFIMGQFTIVCVSELANKISGGTAKTEVKKQNTCAGVFLGLRLVTASTIVSNPISNSDSVVTFFVMLSLGFIFVQCTKFMFRLSLASEDTKMGIYEVVIAGRPFKSEKNWGNALVEGVIMLCSAGIFGSFLRGCDCYAQWVVQLA
jgi:uncharacterized membrane protein YjfL (UPF0719 family)